MDSPDPEGKYKVLEKYAINLTDKARNKKLDPVIGRDSEIRRIMQVLTRRTKNNDSYDEFPKHKELENFDISDRKFIAVSNAHINKPPIIQGTDSKWWGWKNGLSEVGISVIFLCEKYIENKYNKKMN